MRVKKVAFTMYPAVDMARAERFYRDTLELPRGSGSVEAGWLEFDLPLGGCIALTVHSGSGPSSVSGGTIALEVDDLDEIVGRLRSDGVRILASGIESPVCRMAVCLDSEGNKFVLHELRPR